MCVYVYVFIYTCFIYYIFIYTYLTALVRLTHLMTTGCRIH